MNTIAVTIRVEVPLKRARRGGIDGITVMKTMMLPFLPRKGDMLAIGDGGEYLVVDEIFWHPKDGFDIWCESLDQPAPKMLKQGWREFV